MTFHTVPHLYSKSGHLAGSLFATGLNIVFSIYLSDFWWLTIDYVIIRQLMINLNGWWSDWMPYFHGNLMVNVAGFESIIWSFLWENACDCYVAIVTHDITMHLIVMAPHVYTQWHHHAVINILPVLYTEIMKYICIQWQLHDLMSDLLCL